MSPTFDQDNCFLSMTVIFLSCAMFNLLLAVFHMFFWKLFKWKSDLQSISVANRAIIQIFNVLGIYLFIVAGLAFVLFYPALMDSAGGRFFVVTAAVFWAIRLVLQFVFFDHKYGVIQFLSFIFLLGTILHILPLLLSS